MITNNQIKEESMRLQILIILMLFFTVFVSLTIAEKTSNTFDVEICEELAVQPNDCSIIMLYTVPILQNTNSQFVNAKTYYGLALLPEFNINPWLTNQKIAEDNYIQCLQRNLPLKTSNKIGRENPKLFSLCNKLE